MISFINTTDGTQSLYYRKFRYRKYSTHNIEPVKYIIHV